ncbi:hypothetical protein B0H12DRAFT_1130127 [Mycena haematopus]|nr:hypothetical protein B0H12DRAFT_1130127 [Mycena haematopus]
MMYSASRLTRTDTCHHPPHCCGAYASPDIARRGGCCASLNNWQSLALPEFRRVFELLGSRSASGSVGWVYQNLYKAECHNNCNTHLYQDAFALPNPRSSRCNCQCIGKSHPPCRWLS